MLFSDFFSTLFLDPATYQHVMTYGSIPFTQLVKVEDHLLWALDLLKVFTFTAWLVLNEENTLFRINHCASHLINNFFALKDT